MKQTELDKVLTTAEALCRKKGVRLTDQRKTVLQLILAAEKPISAYDILDQLRASIKNPAPPTVYRALDFLLDQGLIHKLESLHAFVACTHPDHPHVSQFLICSDCGEVNEMENDAIFAGLKSAEQALGFTTKKPVIELLGTCADCAKQSKN